MGREEEKEKNKHAARQGDDVRVTTKSSSQSYKTKTSSPQQTHIP
jgi:hypothetical protein